MTSPHVEATLQFVDSVFTHWIGVGTWEMLHQRPSKHAINTYAEKSEIFKFLPSS